jgi:small subunit ribosomal protein S20
LQEIPNVAHSLSAKKRIRQNLKRRAHNRARKQAIKEQVRLFVSALTGGDVGKAETEFRKVAQRLDKVAAKGTIHKNTAARRRSRLARRLNALRAAGPAAATKTTKGRGKGKGTSAATA